MAEYIKEDRYIKLSQALEVLDSCSCWHAHDRMELIPAADVQHVVRCINCKYYEGLACCKLIGDCGGTNWFCGWGEPKEER